MRVVSWLGKTRCDFCGDAVTKQGSWVLMCDSCFHLYGRGEIGLGKGQKYCGANKEKIGG